MQRLLALASLLELIIGLALMFDPSLAARLQLGGEISENGAAPLQQCEPW